MSVEIKRYSDFATIEKRFDGDKIKIDDIINTGHIERHYGEMEDSSIVSSIMSYYGWLKHCNSHNLQRKYIFENENLMGIYDDACGNLEIVNRLQMIKSL